MSTGNDFMYRDLPRLGKKVHRLGFAANKGIDAKGIRSALDLGINYIFWNFFAFNLVAPLREVLKRDREKYIVASGPTLGFSGAAVRRRLEYALKTMNTDYIDIFQLFWLGRMSAWTDGTVAELLKLKQEGKIRAIGVSIHDRERAGRLAKDSPLDLLMVRYNAAHPGAEKDIFPQLHGDRPAIVSYTATAWNRLLKRPRGWSGSIPTPGDCYRFCLSHPHVDVALCGPANLAQLQDNLRALEKGPLSDQELADLRTFGKVVHG